MDDGPNATDNAEARCSPLRSDNPIRNTADDLLGRSKSAEAFARQVFSLDASEGLVVGVLGPWGSGKTSFVNLARHHLEGGGAAIIDFNPWMFSGTEHLVESFFAEVAAQIKLKKNMAQIGDDLDAYAEAFSGMGWVPVAGPWIERARASAAIVANLLRRRAQGTDARRRKLEQALRRHGKPLVVVLDDIDRLTTAEIRDVFKLVRLTASFPNIIYVVAFDRARVEQALEEHCLPGRDYLAKILQVAIDLPVVAPAVFDKVIFETLDSANAAVDYQGHFDEERWPDIYMEVIRPLLGTMRDVRRYAVAMHGALQDLGDQVTLVDVCALEAVRVFLPDVFNELPHAIQLLTTDPDEPGIDDDAAKAHVDRLLDAALGRPDVVRSMLHRLFPGGRQVDGNTRYGPEFESRWLQARRVAHEDVFRLYLERVVGESLGAYLDARRARVLLAHRDELDGFLRSLDLHRVEAVIKALEHFENEFTTEHAISGCVVLLNLLPDLSERPRGMSEIGTRMVVGRVVYRLIRAVGDADATEAAVREILPQVTTLSSRLELIHDVGHRENVGHKLVSEAAAKQLEAEWRAQVRAGDASVLSPERNLIGVLLAARRYAESPEPTLSIPATSDMTVALLNAARGEVRSQEMGTRAIRRSPRLGWDALAEIYGDEATLRAHIAELRTDRPDADPDLLALAGRYADGWRPRDFDDD